MYKYQGPFMVIEMPINRDGHGPEMDQRQVVAVVYQIWDSNNATFKQYSSRSRAEYVCRKMNKEFADNG